MRAPYSVPSDGGARRERAEHQHEHEDQHRKGAASQLFFLPRASSNSMCRRRASSRAKHCHVDPESDLSARRIDGKSQRRSRGAFLSLASSFSRCHCTVMLRHEALNHPCFNLRQELDRAFFLLATVWQRDPVQLVTSGASWRTGCMRAATEGSAPTGRPRKQP